MGKELERHVDMAYTADEIVKRVEQLRAESEIGERSIHLFTKNAKGFSALRWDEDINLFQPGGMWDRIVAFFTGIDPIQAGLRQLNLTDSELDEYSHVIENGGTVIVSYIEALQPGKQYSGEGMVAASSLFERGNEAGVASEHGSFEVYEPVDTTVVMGNRYIEDEELAEIERENPVEPASFGTEEPPPREIFSDAAPSYNYIDDVHKEALAMNAHYDLNRDYVSETSVPINLYETDAEAEAVFMDTESHAVNFSTKYMDNMHEEALAMNAEYNRMQAATRTEESTETESLSNELDALHEEALAMNSIYEESRKASDELDALYEEALAVNLTYEESQKASDELNALHEEALAINAAFDIDRVEGYQVGQDAPEVDYYEQHLDKLHEEALQMNTAQVGETVSSSKSFDEDLDYLHTMALKMNKEYDEEQIALSEVETDFVETRETMQQSDKSNAQQPNFILVDTEESQSFIENSETLERLQEKMRFEEESPMAFIEGVDHYTNIMEGQSEIPTNFYTNEAQADESSVITDYEKNIFTEEDFLMNEDQLTLEEILSTLEEGDFQEEERRFLNSNENPLIVAEEWSNAQVNEPETALLGDDGEGSEGNIVNKDDHQKE